MEISIHFGEDFEVRRVRNTLNAMPWFREHGYRPFLPEGIDEILTDDQIRTAVESVFDPEPYEMRKHEILSAWDNIQAEWSSAVRNAFPDVPEDITIFLTRYGVDGSYNPPNTVVYSLRDNDGLPTILHEIIHLCIQEDIDRYHVQHWVKERIVDCVLHAKEFAFLGDSCRWQRDYRGTDAVVDEPFRRLFFTNREGFYRNLSSQGVGNE